MADNNNAIGTTGPLPPEDLRPTRAKNLKKVPLYIANIIVNLFSGTGKRDPPSDNKTLHGRLITIAVSHFCEKARWGLDLLEAEPTSPFYYTEDGHAPPFVAFATVPASGDKASATPMLVFDSKEKNEPNFIYKSDVILKQMCPFLYPEEIKNEVSDLEADLGKRLGAGIRCFAYHNLLDPPYDQALKTICSSQTCKVETILFDKMLDKGVSKAMRKIIHVNAETAAPSLKAVRDVFAEMSQRLQENDGGYLMDTKTKSYGFTAADLTFAALGQIVVMPPEMSEFQCLTSQLPPEVVSLVEELRPTPAGQHILKMYRMHRFGVGNQPVLNEDGSRVLLKSIGRNRFPWVGLMLSVGGVVAAASLVRHRRS